MVNSGSKYINECRNSMKFSPLMSFFFIKMIQNWHHHFGISTFGTQLDIKQIYQTMVKWSLHAVLCSHACIFLRLHFLCGKKTEQMQKKRSPEISWGSAPLAFTTKWRTNCAYTNLVKEHKRFQNCSYREKKNLFRWKTCYRTTSLFDRGQLTPRSNLPSWVERGGLPCEK